MVDENWLWCGSFTPREITQKKSDIVFHIILWVILRSRDLCSYLVVVVVSGSGGDIKKRNHRISDALCAITYITLTSLIGFPRKSCHFCSNSCDMKQATSYYFENSISYYSVFSLLLLLSFSV
jgi:hypothetical protein